MARLSEPLRICLLLSVVGSFSTLEIAQMLDLEEAAVRQRLARARKQFQRLYALESGEEIVDNTQADESVLGTINRPLRDDNKGSVNRHRNHSKHVNISNERRHLSIPPTTPGL
jgi:hypothetical protein